MKLNPLAIMSEKEDGTGLVFNPETNWAMSFNSTGVFLWQKLKAGATEADLVAALLKIYSGITEAQASSDVRAFVAKLRAHSLLLDD